MQSAEAARVIVVLGTGGTIAGTAQAPQDNVGYRAAQLGVAQLLAAVPAPAGPALECEQVLQLDSKDMDEAAWRQLALRTSAHLARSEVQAVVVTHGSDTLEETAYFLQRVLAPAKPVVLTAAMRPASALLADGPQNLADALALARHEGARGVLVAVAGRVFAAAGLRKTHPYRLDAFSAGEAGPLGVMEEGRLRRFREWPAGVALGAALLEREPDDWPRVEIVLNHAGADGDIVRALVAQGVDGIVAAGTGNGSLSERLERALAEAAASGVAVRLATRCACGVPVGVEGASSAPTAVQARVELMLELLVARRGVLRPP